MELIERYVHQVGRFLPGRDRDDIQDELRSLLLDKLESEVDVADSGTAKPSTEDVVVALLEEMGSPRQVAASYSGDRYLVGPALYPLLWQVLQIGFVIYTIVHIVLLVFGSTSSAIPDLLEFAGSYVGNLLSFFGTVVIVFAILERQDVKLQEIETEWDPRALPEVDEPGRVDLVGLFFGLAFNLIFLSFALHFWRQGGVSMVMNPFSESQILPLPGRLLLIVAGLIVLQILTDLYVFLQRRWQVSTRLIRTLLDVVTVYPVYSLLAVLLSGLISTIAPLESLAPIAQQGLKVGMSLAAVIALVDGIVKTYKLLSGGRVVIPLG